MAEQLAEIGVILLMFGVGLQFHLEELLAVRGIAIPGALVQMHGVDRCSAPGLRYAMGWSPAGSFVFGIALAVASTVVVMRVLSDHNALHTPAGHIAVGWLVVEDIFTVLAIVLLPAMFGSARIRSLDLGRRRAHRAEGDGARRVHRDRRRPCHPVASSIVSPRRDRASCSR